MEVVADDIAAKLNKIREEADVIEMRVVNTRKHVEHAEQELESVKHVIFKGFHTVNEKINQMETELHGLMDKIDQLVKKLEQKL